MCLGKARKNVTNDSWPNFDGALTIVVHKDFVENVGEHLQFWGVWD